jgi:hypothetical protein
MVVMNRKRSAFLRYPQKMKSFLVFTAIVEGLTGLALMGFPSRVVMLLLGSALIGPASFIVSIIAGAAIFSVAIICWLFRENRDASPVIKMLTFYNLSVSIIFLLGVFNYGLNGAVLWLVTGFHLFQAVRGIIIIQKKKSILRS